MPPPLPRPGWAMGSQEALKQGLWSSCVYQVVIQAWCCGGPQGWRSKQARHGPMGLGALCLPTSFTSAVGLSVTLGRICNPSQLQSPNP